MSLESLEVQTETSSNENELPGNLGSTVASVSLTDLHLYTERLDRQQGTSFDLFATNYGL